jgi:hypothetical protein
MQAKGQGLVKIGVVSLNGVKRRSIRDVLSSSLPLKFLALSDNGRNRGRGRVRLKNENDYRLLEIRGRNFGEIWSTIARCSFLAIVPQS